MRDLDDRVIVQRRFDLRGEGVSREVDHLHRIIVGSVAEEKNVEVVGEAVLVHTDARQVSRGERLNVDEDEYANTITLEYSISDKGTWSVEGNNMVEKLNEVNIEFSGASTIANNEDDEVYIEAFKQHYADIIPEMRNEMLKKSREKIIKLTEDELTIKVDEGEEITLTRIE